MKRKHLTSKDREILLRAGLSPDCIEQITPETEVKPAPLVRRHVYMWIYYVLIILLAIFGFVLIIKFYNDLNFQHNASLIFSVLLFALFLRPRECNCSNLAEPVAAPGEWLKFYLTDLASTAQPDVDVKGNANWNELKRAVTVMNSHMGEGVTDFDDLARPVAMAVMEWNKK